ncbi:MAG: hypothetical protein IJB59_02635 [Oscillospiraceae bacterium]|nr:hypothetical protein [Oscillospiraceae bacterium]
MHIKLTPKKLFLLLLILGVLVFYSNNKTGISSVFPIIQIQELSKIRYDDALYLYQQNPIHNGIKRAKTSPEGNSLHYYMVSIIDEGYRDTLPIMEEIFFVTDKHYEVIKNSCFIVAEEKDLTSLQLKYLNSIVSATNFDVNTNEVLLTLRVNTVYNRFGSHDFDYHVCVVVDLANLSIISYTHIP